MMLRRFVGLFFVVAIALLATLRVAAAQETLRGVALVIGNGDYEHLAPLTNPPADADAIEELLSDLGFDSVRRTDRDADDLARDLERFVEDAEGADVAVLYYAGHGIEAGGENWLVPVDADISALDAAATRLVPVSDVIRRLRETVAVTIVLLDACRDNPFPAGAALKLAANADPLPVSAGGLGEPGRGASPVLTILDSSITQAENLGIVIGFAAAPGQVALDGASGENSPYAAALTRHISAMAGEEFGTVMRMVGEEVYLKTNGRQRPWVNESLRRLLYFGEAPKPVEGPEGDILTERRQLLLTISTLPTFGRSQVERVARNGGVPMDAVFAMLKALGSDTPDDPIELERILKSQTEELKRFLADRRVIENPDPELARLSALSDQAVAEGALDTARRLRAEVDRRIQELSAVIENEEELIRARRTEFAAEYAKSAEVAALSFDYAAAAAEYEKAHEQIARWDDRLAWDYRRRQIEQLLDDNRYRGDVKGFARAGELALELLQDGRNLGNAELAESHLVYASFLSSNARMRRDPESREKALENIDAALALLPPGEKRSDALGYKATILKLVGSELGVQPRLDEAAATYEEVFRDITPDGNPDLWQDMLSEYGNVLGLIAMRDQSAPKLRLSIEKLEEASRLAGEDDPLGRIIIDLQLATFRIAIPEIENSAGNDVELVNSVLVEMEASRDRIDAEQFPLARGLIEHAIAMTLIWRASSTGEDAVVDQAIDAFKRALEFRTRDRAPGEWAETSEQLGYAYNRKASITKDPAYYEQAAAYLENALAVYSPQNVPANWASVEFSRLVALRSIATAARDAKKLAEIAARVRAGLAEPALSALPDQMMNFGQELGLALWERYRIEGGLELLHQEVTELEAVLAAVEGSASPLEVGMTLLLVGDAANEIGKKETGTGFLHTAADAYGRSLALRTDQNPVDAGRIYFVRASVLKEIAEREGDKSYLHEAIANLETSLQLFDRDEYPVDYANALLDRATFQHALAERADEPLVRKLIAAYGEALELYESAGDNLRTAIAARNLGFAYQTLDWVTSKEEHHQDAAKAYRKAIESGSGLGIEVDMFISHYELAQSLVGINRAAPSPELLQEALVSYRAAAATPQNLVGPRRWGDAQQKTAELLLHFGRNERNAELLGEAAAFFRAALTVRAPERSLLDWYYSKDGLKEALTQQALLTPGTAEIEELRGALRELMDRYPPDWRRNGLAEYQADMADVLHELNLRGGDPALLKDSAAFFRLSLETAEENTHPSFFVSINRKLAAVLKRAAALSGDMDIYRQSAAASRAALTYIDASNAEMRAFTQRDLGLVLSTLGDSGGDMNALEESIDVLSSAIDHFNADDYPAEWADLTNNIAWLNVLAGRHYGDIARFESAANDLKFVVAIQRDIGNTATLAFSEDSLCAALYEIGRARSEKPLLENAADACASAIEHFRANGMEDFADGSTKLLSQVEDAMAAAD